MNTLELDFRKDLLTTMNGVWIPTIHAENKYNPGVPDLSYVISLPGHETGWLELKAIDAPRNDRYSFHVEPSQHRWIEAHFRRVPVHLLLAVGRVAWLVPGEHHKLFVEPLTYAALNSIGKGFQMEALRQTLYHELSTATSRGRST